jgi:hypothetical protein
MEPSEVFFDTVFDDTLPERKKGRKGVNVDF